jgi:hypothetical protein
MKRYQMLIIGFIMSVTTGFAFAGSIEEKWGAPLVGPFGLKEYVVSLLSAKSQPDFEQQKLKVAKPTAELLSKIDVMPFLFAYDSLGAERDIEDLAKLSPYYLGEAAGTLYQCLVLRKGQKILPALQKLAKRKSNECIERFGQDANVCLSDNEYRAHIKKYIEAISSLTKTNQTTSLCTTSGWSSM